MGDPQSKSMTFKALLGEYRDACAKWKAARHENNETQTRKWRGEARSLALMIADFLLDHNATVTFAAPSEPPSAAPAPTAFDRSVTAMATALEQGFPPDGLRKTDAGVVSVPDPKWKFDDKQHRWYDSTQPRKEGDDDSIG